MSKSKKRMTSKEFKRIFELAYGEDTFKFYGYEHILNILSSFEHHSAEQSKEMGFNAIAQEATKRSYIIYDELEKIGYYDR